jgi:ribosomal protein S20
MPPLPNSKKKNHPKSKNGRARSGAALPRGVRRRIKRFHAALEGPRDALQRRYDLAVKKLAQAAERGKIDPDVAARETERLSRLLNEQREEGSSQRGEGQPSGSTANQGESPLRRELLKPPFETIYQNALAQMMVKPTRRAKERLRANLLLQYEHPDQYVAFHDVWEGETLKRQIVRAAPSMPELLHSLASLPPDERERVKIDFAKSLDENALFVTFDLPPVGKAKDE